jgi:predicted SnoaL-like aldol condensation-catalyzing enzyme
MKPLTTALAAVCLLIAPPCAQAAAPSGDALLAQNKELVTKFFAAFTASVTTGVPDPQLDMLVAKDYEQHETGVAPGLDGLKSRLIQLHAAIPDLTCKVTDVLAEGDRVVDRTACTYHDRRSNQTATDISIDEFRIAAGKLAEHSNWSE